MHESGAAAAAKKGNRSANKARGIGNNRSRNGNAFDDDNDDEDADSEDDAPTDPIIGDGLYQGVQEQKDNNKHVQFSSTDPQDIGVDIEKDHSEGEDMAAHDPMNERDAQLEGGNYEDVTGGPSFNVQDIDEQPADHNMQ